MSGVIGLPNSKSGVLGRIHGEADCWRLTGHESNGNTYVTGDCDPLGEGANDNGALERDHTYGFSGALGKGMTNSAGVFTFPTTGYWHVNFHMECQHSSNDSGRYAYLQVSTNAGSNWYTASSGRLMLYHSSFAGCSVNKIINVTATSQVKVKFASVGNHTSTQMLGHANENRTFFTFQKIGKT